MRRKTSFVAFIERRAAWAALLFLCFGMTFAPCEGHAVVRVVGTLPDFAQLAEELGGERVEADSLILGTEDCHFVDPKPSHVVRLHRADLLVFIGLELESGWLPPLLTQARNTKIQPGEPGYLDASTVIDAKEVPVNIDRSMGDLHSGGNPHYYASPLEMKKVAEAISARLMELDPEGRSVYESRLNTFRAKFDRKMKEWAAAAAPFKGKAVVEYHKSWIYVIDWLGMKSIGALEPKPGIPPSPSHVTQLLMRVRSKNVAFVFQSVYQSSRLARVFASKSEARLLLLPSMVGSYPEIKTVWDKWDYMIAMLTEK